MPRSRVRSAVARAGCAANVATMPRSDCRRDRAGSPPRSRRDALARVGGERSRHAPLHARAGFGRRELPPLFPRDARRGRRSRAGAAHADRDGRAAAAGGLPRRSCTSRSCCARAGVHAPRGARRRSRPRLPAAHRSRRPHLSRRARRRVGARALLRCDRRADPLAAARRAKTSCRRTTRRCCARELDLFPDWYVARHLGVALAAAQARHARGGVPARPRQQSRAAARVRPSRLPLAQPDGRASPIPASSISRTRCTGPITYDLVSLLRDAYVAWDEERQIDWAVRYWERARKAGLPVGDDFGAFWRDFEWMGVQRQLKVLGIFARLVPSRRQGRLSRRHAARDGVPARRVRALPRRSRRCSRCSTSSKAGRSTAAVTRSYARFRRRAGRR